MIPKRTTALLRLFALAMLSLASLLPARAAVVSFSPSTFNVTAGQTFLVDIRISGAVDLYAFQFDLGFDPNFVSANAVTEGTFLSSGGSTLFIDGTIDNAAGTISDVANALNGAVPGVDGAGVLATVSFTASHAGFSNLTFFNPIFVDSNQVDVSVGGVAPAGVTVTGQLVVVPEPSSTCLIFAALAGLAITRRRLHRPPPPQPAADASLT